MCHTHRLISHPQLACHVTLQRIIHHVSHTYTRVTHIHMCHTHTHVSHTYTCLTHIHTCHTHTHVSHTYTCLTHIHTCHTHTHVSHTYTCLAHRHMCHTHTHVSHAYTCVTRITYTPKIPLLTYTWVTHVHMCHTHTHISNTYLSCHNMCAIGCYMCMGAMGYYIAHLDIFHTHNLHATIIPAHSWLIIRSPESCVT